MAWPIPVAAPVIIATFVLQSHLNPLSMMVTNSKPRTFTLESENILGRTPTKASVVAPYWNINGFAFEFVSSNIRRSQQALSRPTQSNYVPLFSSA
jgi:hypothetical protein